MKMRFKREISLIVLAVILAVAAIAGSMMDRRARRESRGFAVDRYTHAMKRVDSAVESIGDRLTFEGLALDFEALLATVTIEAEGPQPQAPEAAPPPASDRPPDVDISLVGVVWSQTAPLAFLNDQCLGVGEKIGGRELVEIRAESVLLKAPDGTVTQVFLYGK